MLVWPAMLIVFALAASPVLADTNLGKTGKVGQNSLNDAHNLAGAECDFVTGGTVMIDISVRQPNIWGRNTTSGTDTQRVGWRFIVLRKKDTSSTWKQVYQSQIYKAKTTDQHSAVLEPESFQPGWPTDPPGHSSKFQVQVKMYWYRSGAVEGTQTRRVDTYLETNQGPLKEVHFCDSTYS